MTYNFDFPYWGLYLDELEQVEKETNRIGELYKLSDDDMEDIEKDAKSIATSDLKHCDSPFNEGGNLTQIIGEAKVQALINKICMKYNPYEDTFDYYVNGSVVKIYRNGEEL